MKPVACGNQVYSTGSLSSRATMSAILFSKPSPLSFENGILAGSAQTRNAVRSTRSTRCACDFDIGVATVAMAAPTSSTAVSLEHDPEKWEPVFGKRSCSNEKIDHDLD